MSGDDVFDLDDTDLQRPTLSVPLNHHSGPSRVMPQRSVAASDQKRWEEAVDHERTNLFAFFSHLDRDDLGDSAGARHTQLLRAAEQASMKLDEFRRSTNHQYWQLRSVVRGLYDDAAKPDDDFSPSPKPANHLRKQPTPFIQRSSVPTRTWSASHNSKPISLAQNNRQKSDLSRQNSAAFLHHSGVTFDMRRGSSPSAVGADDRNMFCIEQIHHLQTYVDELAADPYFPTEEILELFDESQALRTKLVEFREHRINVDRIKATKWVTDFIAEWNKKLHDNTALHRAPSRSVSQSSSSSGSESNSVRQRQGTYIAAFHKLALIKKNAQSANVSPNVLDSLLHHIKEAQLELSQLEDEQSNISLPKLSTYVEEIFSDILAYAEKNGFSNLTRHMSSVSSSVAGFDSDEEDRRTVSRSPSFASHAASASAGPRRPNRTYLDLITDIEAYKARNDTDPSIRPGSSLYEQCQFQADTLLHQIQRAQQLDDHPNFEVFRDRFKALVETTDKLRKSVYSSPIQSSALSVPSRHSSNLDSRRNSESERPAPSTSASGSPQVLQNLTTAAELPRPRRARHSPLSRRRLVVGTGGITLKNPQSNAGAAIRRAPLLPPRHMQSLAKADGSEYEHAAYLTSRQAQRYQF